MGRGRPFLRRVYHRCQRTGLGLGSRGYFLLLLFGLLLYAAAERWQFSGAGRASAGEPAWACAPPRRRGLAYGAALYALTPLWAVLGSDPLALLALLLPRRASPSPQSTAWKWPAACWACGNSLRNPSCRASVRWPRKTPNIFTTSFPDASVFRLEEEWAGRFDGMAVPPPVWYGCGDMTVWNVISFSHMMHHGVDHSMTQLQQTVAEQSGGSSGGGGSFGGSGGGFSGGGFGGGGGGRW